MASNMSAWAPAPAAAAWHSHPHHQSLQGWGAPQPSQRGRGCQKGSHQLHHHQSLWKKGWPWTGTTASRSGKRGRMWCPTATSGPTGISKQMDGRSSSSALLAGKGGRKCCSGQKLAHQMGRHEDSDPQNRVLGQGRMGLALQMHPCAGWHPRDSEGVLGKRTEGGPHLHLLGEAPVGQKAGDPSVPWFCGSCGRFGRTLRRMPTAIAFGKKAAIEKKIWRWCGSLWKKRLAEESLKSAGILCKKDAAFLLGKATPSKRGSLWKKGGCLPWVQTCWKTTGVHHQVAMQKRCWAWVGRGMGATSNVLGWYPPNNFLGSWDVLPFFWGVISTKWIYLEYYQDKWKMCGVPKRFKVEIFCSSWWTWFAIVVPKDNPTVTDP